MEYGLNVKGTMLTGCPAENVKFVNFHVYYKVT